MGKVYVRNYVYLALKFFRFPESKDPISKWRFSAINLKSEVYATIRVLLYSFRFDTIFCKKSRWASGFADKSFWDFDGSQEFLLSRLWRDPLRRNRHRVTDAVANLKEV